MCTREEHEKELQAREEKLVHMPLARYMDSVAIPLTDEQRKVTEEFFVDYVLDGFRSQATPLEEPEALKRIKNAEHDFLWDRATGLVFFSLIGEHTELASRLYTGRHCTFESALEGADDASTYLYRRAEDYVNAGEGFILSSLKRDEKNPILKVGKGVTLTGQEKMLLKRYNLLALSDI